MSLAINTNAVTRVLLADGWYSVVDQSFDLDAYEYRDGADRDGIWLHRGGIDDICATGFSFLGSREDGVTVRISGPLTAVLAVATTP